jgi:hypothetical protein
MMNAYAVSVTDEVTLLVEADDLNRPIWVHVNSNETIYIGGDDVDTTTGFPLVKHSAPLAGGLPPKTPLYAIAETGKTVDVRVITPPID